MECSLQTLLHQNQLLVTSIQQATTPANSEDITAFVNDDPFQEYIIASDATLGGTLALRKSKIGLTYATTAAAGSTTTGKSSIQLGISTAATTAKQLRVVKSS